MPVSLKEAGRLPENTQKARSVQEWGGAVLGEAVGEIVFSRQRIQRRIGQLARQIQRDYAGTDLVVVSVLKGAIYFLCDLTRLLDLRLKLDFMAISSYGPNAPTGVVRIEKDLDSEIGGKHVLLVEDIIDTGMTLAYLIRQLSVRTPASLEVCTLLDRPYRRIVDLPVKYAGFEAPERFLVGYGLDYECRYRNLPYIATLKETALKL